MKKLVVGTLIGILCVSAVVILILSPKVSAQSLSPPTVALLTPAVDGYFVQVNGAVNWGDYKPGRIWWDWGENPTEEVWQEGGFVNSHTYPSLEEETYVISVKAEYGDGLFSEIETTEEFTLYEEDQSGGITVKIDNSNGGGDVFYRSSLNPDGETIGSGDDPVELYLAEGDIVWEITAIPNEGLALEYWDISDSNMIREGFGFSETSNPIDIVAIFDGEIIPYFLDRTILTVSCEPTEFDTTDPQTITISGTLTDWSEEPLEGMDIELSYSGKTTNNKGTIDTATTDENGEFSVEWDPPIDLANDEYVITAHQPSDDNYASNTATTGIDNAHPNLLVVPEYLFGTLAAMAACFVGFAVFKKRDSIATRIRIHN